MTNNVNADKVSALLKERYYQNVQLTELREGRDKDVYAAKLADGREFVVLINKKNTLMRRYRTMLSNDFQKNLYRKDVYVPDVLDLFELDNGIIVACHTYIRGRQIEKLDNKTAWQCGRIVAQMHKSVMSGKNYCGGYSLKYKMCGVIKFFTNRIRLLKDIVTDCKILEFPNGLCHRNLNLSNFIFTNNDVYLIDFDRHRLWPFVYEIKRFLKSEDNCEYAVDFLKGYQSIRQLTQKERQYLSEQEFTGLGRCG